MTLDVTVLPPRRTVPGVAELVQQIGETLASRFGACVVRGELSGFTRASSGHCYFTLKDADGAPASMRCAMFRRAAGLLAFAPADGQLVELRGRVAVYEPRGELQLVVEAMQRGGAGALYEQFLAIRARLEALGLFDPARKRPLTPHPAAVGIVTSLGAAALHDALTALRRRSPQVRVVVYPSLVQGADAPASIAAAIGAADLRDEVDVLLVCRGGGSLEDLWAFNDERVVRAIAACRVPVVSGVGHETDVTLADLAADLRAPTPTAAAELAAPLRDAELAVLSGLETALRRRLHGALDQQAQRLDRAGMRLLRPSQGLQRQAERLSVLAHRWSARLPQLLQARHAELAALEAARRGAVVRRLQAERAHLAGLEGRMRALDPRQVLQRGYAWLDDGQGRAYTSATQLHRGDAVRAVLHDGTVDLRVERSAVDLQVERSALDPAP